MYMLVHFCSLFRCVVSRESGTARLRPVCLFDIRQRKEDMKKRKIIKRTNLGYRLPVTNTFIAWYLMDRFNAPGWLWGALGLFFLVAWIATITDMLNESEVDMLGDTTIECERLQGFPDNYTQTPWNKKDAENCPDGPRYKALGNSMAVDIS